MEAHKQTPHNKFQDELSAPGRQKQTKVSIEFLDKDIICGNILRIPKESLFKKIQENKLWIAGTGTICPEVEILIGSDTYGQPLTVRVTQLNTDSNNGETRMGRFGNFECRSHLV